jgi:photosystem II stability/assembly factor-like uncharacterized protein
MSGPSGIRARTGDVLLMIGTTKGAFLLHGDGERRSWEMEGPHFPGEETYALALDQRGGRRALWAAPSSPFWGTALLRSDDLGGSWTDKEEIPVRFPEDSGLALKRVWQITPGRESEPDRMFLGVEPSCLFESQDGGASWEPVPGYLKHPHREFWSPGNGGLCLHTILLDPARSDRMLAAQSTGGVYRTEDGGRSWQARNQGVRVDFMPEKYPEFGQCVHKVVQSRQRPDRMFLQNHWGLYRSDDRGERWTDIANGVPSDFGFGLAIHPRDADCAWIVPLESDEFRCTPEGRLRVYRTRDAGASWQPLSNGLPQEGAYETVLRDALAVDTRDPAGVYFGTRSGKVFASGDEGESWSTVVDGLPPVIAVKAVAIV